MSNDSKLRDVNAQAKVTPVETPQKSGSAILDAVVDFFKSGLKLRVDLVDYSREPDNEELRKNEITICECSSYGMFNGLYNVYYREIPIVMFNRLTELASAVGLSVKLLQYVIPDLQKRDSN